MARPNLAHLKDKNFILEQLPHSSVMRVVDEEGESVMLAGLPNDLDPIALAVMEIPNMVQALEMFYDSLCHEPESINFIFVNHVLQKLSKK